MAKEINKSNDIHNMNILFVTRLYSGFEKSLYQKVWRPEGVPTIYNLLQKLSLNHTLSIVFTVKDSVKPIHQIG